MHRKAASSEIRIHLPDLKKPSGIQPSNIFALQPIYVAAQLEGLKIFSVVDRLVELALNGTLPVGSSPAARLFSDYAKKSDTRLTAAERRDLYSRAFGIDSGNTTPVTPNREFNELWVRFVSAVSEFVQQLNRGRSPVFAQRKVRKPARDLAENLSLHGYGIGYFAACELQTQVNDMISILSHPDIRSAYGATSMWQVVAKVAVADLGGAVNTPRYRTLATTGAVVIRIVACSSQNVSSPMEATLAHPGGVPWASTLDGPAKQIITASNENDAFTQFCLLLHIPPSLFLLFSFPDVVTECFLPSSFMVFLPNRLSPSLFRDVMTIL